MCWLIAVSFAFWKSFLIDYRWFLASPEILPASLPVLPEISRPTLLHFSDPECPCTRYSQPHVEKLNKRYPDLQQFMVEPGSSYAAYFETERGNYLSSPAVALIDERGKVRYLGPYTAGKLCGQGDDLLQQPIKGLAQNKEIPIFNYFHFGCYCSWPTTDFV